MKLKQKKWTGLGKVFSVIAVSAMLILSCSKDDTYSNPQNSTMYSITGNANGNSVVPAVSDSGSATISGTYNSYNMVLTYNTSWKSLTGAPTSGGFYTGSSGANGAAVGPAWVFDSTALANSAVSGQFTLTPDQAKQLTSGNWYYIIGTAAHPGGEVRGQITSVVKTQ